MTVPSLRTIAQVAERLQVDDKTVRRLIKRGELKAYRLGRQLRISDDDLLAYLDKNRL